jgi:hypothetical protein
VKAAYLYWAVLTAGSPPEAVESVNIQRVFPAPASPLRTIRGGVVGQGPEPCWGSFNGATTVTVYRSAVPLSVADGNGTYVVTLNANAAGATAGQDPWVTSPIPNFEGVSLVIVGTGNGRVALYDRGLAGKTFTARNRQTYSLVLPIDVSRATAVEFHTIQADGQRGVGRRAVAKTADEITVMRDVVIAGPGSQLGDGHWNGGTAAPLPQLWDEGPAARSASASIPPTATTVSCRSPTASRSSGWGDSVEPGRCYPEIAEPAVCDMVAVACNLGPPRATRLPFAAS